MKKIIIAIIIALALAGVGTGIAFGANRFFSNNNFFEAGRAEKEMLDSRGQADSVYIKSESFSIYKDEIDKIEEQYRIAGVDNGRELAIESLIRRETLYAEAVKNGFYATESEVREKLDYYLELTQKGENFESDVMPFLAGAEMTHEEYWESQYDVVEKEIVTGKYYDSLRENFFAQNNYPDNSSRIQKAVDEGDSLSLEELEETDKLFREMEKFESEWRVKFDEIVEELIQKQDIQYVE